MKISHTLQRARVDEEILLIIASYELLGGSGEALFVGVLNSGLVSWVYSKGVLQLLLLE